MNLLKKLLFLVLLPITVKAQTNAHTIYYNGTIEFIGNRPNYNPFDVVFDPLTFDGRGVKAPRILFDVGYPLINTGIDWTLEKIHTPKLIRKVIVIGGLPLAPHLIGMYRGLHNNPKYYQLNVADWVFDAINKQPFSRSGMLTRIINLGVLGPYSIP